MFSSSVTKIFFGLISPWNKPNTLWRDHKWKIVWNTARVKRFGSGLSFSTNSFCFCRKPLCKASLLPIKAAVNGAFLRHGLRPPPCSYVLHPAKFVFLVFCVRKMSTVVLFPSSSLFFIWACNLWCYAHINMCFKFHVLKIRMFYGKQEIIDTSYKRVLVA